MECLVYRVPMRDPGDASGITGLIDVFSVYPSVKQAVRAAELARPLPAPAL